MSALTKRQAEIRDFVLNFQSHKGYSPSYKEIGAGVGLSSLATIHAHIQKLQQRGAIRMRPGKKRGIEVRESAGAKVTCPHCRGEFQISSEL